MDDVIGQILFRCNICLLRGYAFGSHFDSGKPSSIYVNRARVPIRAQIEIALEISSTTTTNSSSLLIRADQFYFLGNRARYTQIEFGMQIDHYF